MHDRGGEAPLLIGAVGGSGTRVLARIARHAGLFMGGALNEHEDAQPFVDFYDAWVPLYLKKRDGRLSEKAMAAAEEDFRNALAAHLTGRPDPDAPWGVKNPRSLLMLPFWHRQFPRLRFLHVVRHGLDMACSPSQREVRMYRYIVFNGHERRRPLACQSALYWSRFNVSAAKYAASALRGQALTVRFEALCAEPARVVRQIFEFLGAPADPARVAAATAEVRVPATIGRWRAHAVSEVAEAATVAHEGLVRFGYWDPGVQAELARAAAGPRWHRRLFQWSRMAHLPAA